MRKYLIGVMAAGLVGALTFPSIGSADTTALSITSPVTPTKQDKKVRGGVTTSFTSNDTHAGALLNEPGCIQPNITATCFAFPPSVQAQITFPTDFKFDPGTLPDCNLASLTGKSTAGAREACPRSIVGQGSSVIRTLAGGTLNGVVTAFNGAPSGGSASLYLHVDIAGSTTKPILNGVIRGNTLLGADSAGSRHSDSELQHHDQQDRHQEEEEQEDGQDDEDFLLVRQVLEGYVDDQRDDHLPEWQDADGLY